VNYERSIVIPDKENNNYDSDEESQKCFEVLLSSTYGGFCIPDEIFHAIFALHPPHTEEGKKLFISDTDIPIYLNEQDIPADATRYILQTHLEDYNGEYKYVRGYYVSLPYTKLEEKKTQEYYYYNIITRGDGLYYPIDSFHYSHYDIWREHKDVIRLHREMGFLDKMCIIKGKHNREFRRQTRAKKVPLDRQYYIDDYDGLESIVLNRLAPTVLEDLLRIVKTGDRENINKITQKFIDGKVTVNDIMSDWK
jgi:hypothetical protein